MEPALWHSASYKAGGLYQSALANPSYTASESAVCSCTWKRSRRWPKCFWDPITHVGNPEEILGSYPWPGLVQIIAVI